ncbi:hypothetical protein IFM47457_07720 [Aspergillus lentulus]|nr:hypothetical protein IFM47457_07720 [Aspergillus lentulus]
MLLPNTSSASITEAISLSALQIKMSLNPDPQARVVPNRIELFDMPSERNRSRWYGSLTGKAAASGSYRSVDPARCNYIDLLVSSARYAAAEWFPHTGVPKRAPSG